MLRCGSKYYQFTIKQTRMGRFYLEIAESRITTSPVPQNQTLYVFPEYATKFAIVLNRMLLDLESTAQETPSLVSKPQN